MLRVSILLLTLLVILPPATPRAAAAEPRQGAKLQEELLGSWKLVSAKYGGQEYKFPEGYTTIKHITPSQFMWASYGEDGKVTRAAGGTYTLKGETYEEVPEYGASQDFDTIKGKAHSFQCKIEGNKWHHDGKLENGLTIEEVWVRIEKK